MITLKSPALALISLFGLWAPSAIAQEYGGCFLIDSRGQVVPLENLCGNSSKPSTIQAPAIPTTPGSTAAFTIPITGREGGTPIVDVVINGNQTVKMLFDTGASDIAIGAEVASQLGLALGEVVMVDTAGGTVPSNLSVLQSIQAGNLTRNSLEVLISPSLSGLGLLGQSFFGDFNYTVKEEAIELNPKVAPVVLP